MPFVIDRSRLSQHRQLLRDEEQEVSILKQLCPPEELDPLGEYSFLRQYLNRQELRIQRRLDFLELADETMGEVETGANSIDRAIAALDMSKKF